MRLLVYNPNANQDLTAALARGARKLLEPADALQTATSSSGEAFIGSEASIAAAKAALQNELPRHARECDVVLLACFGDLGVDELRQQLQRPIISLSDAFFAIAPFLGRRIGLLTTSPFWAHRLALDARKRDAAHWIVETRVLAPSKDEAPASLAAWCRSQMSDIKRGGQSDAVVLGGAKLIALAPELASERSLPLIDPLAAAIGLCRAASSSAPYRQGVS